MTPFWAPKQSCSQTAYSDKHSLEDPEVTPLEGLFCCQGNCGSPGPTLPAPVWPGFRRQPGRTGTSSLPLADKEEDGAVGPLSRTGGKTHKYDETSYNKILESLMGNQRKCSSRAYLPFTGSFFWPEVWMRIERRLKLI